MTDKPPRKISPATIGNAMALLILAGIMLLFLPLTKGNWWIASPPQERWWIVCGVLILYIGLCRWSFRKRPNRRTSESLSDRDHESVLVAYASQSGFAYELAEQTANSLRSGGIATHLVALEQINRQQLEEGGRLLLLASTTGEGDPPDHTYSFVRDVLGDSVDLAALEFGLLAIGDRAYEQFCAFGHRLNQWLCDQNAQPLFDLIEVDNADPVALQQWQTQVAKTFQTTKQAAWQPAHCEPWELTNRTHLNPGSPGGSVYHIVLQRRGNEPQTWQPGDIAEITPVHAPLRIEGLLQQLGEDGQATVVHNGQACSLRTRLAESELPDVTECRGLKAQGIADRLQPLKNRDYSIASIPADGRLELVVRKFVRSDGSTGVCSDWLCEQANLQQTIQVRIRSNPSFHPPELSVPLILIGNGTGIAGLRGHIKHRSASKQSGRSIGDLWLLFGERSTAHDFHFKSEIEQWQHQGVLARVDIAFSRDQEERIYVQHKLARFANELKSWVASGAAIYICGSQQGMDPEVDQVLRETLGDGEVDQMLASGRYRRDVY